MIDILLERGTVRNFYIMVKSVGKLSQSWGCLSRWSFFIYYLMDVYPGKPLRF